MVIKAVKFFEKGFAAQGFVMGGEEGEIDYDDPDYEIIEED